MVLFYFFLARMYIYIFVSNNLERLWLKMVARRHYKGANTWPMALWHANYWFSLLWCMTGLTHNEQRETSKVRSILIYYKIEPAHQDTLFCLFSNRTYCMEKKYRLNYYRVNRVRNLSNIKKKNRYFWPLVFTSPSSNFPKRKKGEDRVLILIGNPILDYCTDYRHWI